MAASVFTIIETPDAFIVNGITVRKMKQGQFNTYDPAVIKAIGAELFFDLVAPKTPLPIPDIGFTEAEWDEMEQQLCNKR